MYFACCPLHAGFNPEDDGDVFFQTRLLKSERLLNGVICRNIESFVIVILHDVTEGAVTANQMFPWQQSRGEADLVQNARVTRCGSAQGRTELFALPGGPCEKGLKEHSRSGYGY
jgi:hypothetical protein